MLLRLHDTFPSVNLDWLITGEGLSGLENDNDTATPPSNDTEPDATDAPSYDGISASEGTVAAKYRKENGLGTAVNAAYEAKKQDIVYKERPPRKITEIRIFFDDNTFETFTP